MAGKKTAVFGIYSSVAQAERAVLRRTGAEDIASAGEEAVGATPARDADKR